MFGFVDETTVWLRTYGGIDVQLLDSNPNSRFNRRVVRARVRRPVSRFLFLKVNLLLYTAMKRGATVRRKCAQLFQKRRGERVQT